MLAFLSNATRAVKVQAVSARLPSRRSVEPGPIAESKPFEIHQPAPAAGAYSHSIVAGGFELTS